MSATIVSLTRRGPDRLEVEVRRGEELVTYELTEVSTPLLPVIEFDRQFHRDFPDPDLRSRIFEAARRAFRGEQVHLPLTLTDEPADE